MVLWALGSVRVACEDLLSSVLTCSFQHTLLGGMVREEPRGCRAEMYKSTGAATL